jgi:hypothetical protein
MRIARLSLVFVLAFGAGAIHGCGGSPAAKPTPKCVLASECSGNLVCALGFCVSMCQQSKDCLPSSANLLCVKSDMGNACRAPETAAKGCVLNSDCTKLCSDKSTVCPIVCGRDLTCRTQCATSDDCLKGQVCTNSGACADLILDKDIYDPNTNEFIPKADGGSSDTSVTGQGGTTGGGGTTGAAGTTGGGGTAGGAGTTPDGGSPDGAAGTTGAAGTGSDGGNNPEVAVTPDGVTPLPSDKLRQGQGIGISITVTKAGGGLSNASVVDFGDLKATVQDTSTDTSLVLRVTVPHGVPLGKRTLKVSTMAGLITAADVVEVTAITAGPLGMDTNVGSATSPFKSLKAALAVADIGDTVHLLDGKYTIAATAETWGYTLPDSLTIVGDSTANTIIDGVGAANSPDGFAVAKTLTLQTLTLQHFRYGIDIAMPASTVTLQDVVVAGNSSNGIYVETMAMGSTVNVLGKNSLIDQPTQTAIYVYNVPNVTVNVTDATLQGGYQVVWFSYNTSAGKLTMTGATVKQLSTSYSAIVMQPSNHAVGTTTTLTNCTIVGNVTNSDLKGSMTIMGGTITQKVGAGVEFAGLNLTMTGTIVTMVNMSNQGLDISGMGSIVSLKTVTIDGGNYGVQQSGAGSAVTMRGTTIKNSYYDGYYVTAGDLDMGTATASGDNTILAPAYASGYAIYIGRGGGAASGNPVSASGTAVGTTGNVPAPQKVDASGAVVTKAPQLWYVSAGNILNFF